MNRFDFLKTTNESIDNDLKFAETKNTFLVTFNAAIVGVIIAFLTSNATISRCANVLLIIFSILLLTATITSVMSFFPLSMVGRFLHPKFKGTPPKYMFYLYNKSVYSNKTGMDYMKFESDIKQYFQDNTDFSAYEKQLSIQILDLSHIAYTKFRLFSIALYIEFIAFLTFVAFLIVL